MTFKIDKKEKKNYEQFTTRFEVENMERLRKVAKSNDVSINNLINACVKFALDSLEENTQS